MKVILVGYPGSQIIVPASKYLTWKYMPNFEFIYLNFKGGIEDWGDWIANYLTEYIDDPYVIFALDDYLVADYIDIVQFRAAKDLIEQGGCCCVKLCIATKEENDEYPITTQYTLWDKHFLCLMLRGSKTPWQFEITGSKIYRHYTNAVAKFHTCLNYFTNSSLSSRWKGIRLDGLKEEDINHMKKYGILPEGR